MRRKNKEKREFQPDVVYGRIDISRFINCLMHDGKKSVAEKVFYGALDLIKEKTKKDSLEIFDVAFQNITPTVEIRSRRVGGANYQVPMEVRPERKFALACRWLIGAARSRSGKSMKERLAEEIMMAANNEGAAIKKKLDTHRIAEANKAFAHFAR